MSSKGREGEFDKIDLGAKIGGKQSSARQFSAEADVPAAGRSPVVPSPPSPAPSPLCAPGFRSL